MTRHRPHGDEDGFTLAELLVALFIISGSLLALLSGFIMSAHSVQTQQEAAKANRVALDVNESLRLENYDDASWLQLGQHWINDDELPVEKRKGCRRPEAPASAARPYTCRITVVERDAHPDDTVAGDIVKDITTTISYRLKGTTRSKSYTTSVARDARTIGLPSTYIKAIRGMTISPNPSTIVNFDGQTEEDIRVTVVMTGFEPDNFVRLSWTDNSARTVTGTSTDGRNWQFLLPKYNSTQGLSLTLEPGQQRTITFTATAPGGLSRTGSLTVFGPAADRPVIAPSDWTVTPTPIQMFRNGFNRFQNQKDVTFTCIIDWVKAGSATDDANSVKGIYIGETGTSVEQVLRRVSTSGTKATFTHTFPASTTYFGRGDSQPFTCVARRGVDGGPASRSITVKVN